MRTRGVPRERGERGARGETDCARPNNDRRRESAVGGGVITMIGAPRPRARISTNAEASRGPRVRQPLTFVQSARGGRRAVHPSRAHRLAHGARSARRRAGHGERPPVPVGRLARRPPARRGARPRVGSLGVGARFAIFSERSSNGSLSAIGDARFGRIGWLAEGGRDGFGRRASPCDASCSCSRRTVRVRRPLETRGVADQGPRATPPGPRASHRTLFFYFVFSLAFLLVGEPRAEKPPPPPVPPIAPLLPGRSPLTFTLPSHPDSAQARAAT